MAKTHAFSAFRCNTTWAVTLVAAAGLLVSAVARAAPVEIRMGAGPAADEQLWLMKVRPDLTPHQGKAYSYHLFMFRSSNDRMRAFEAGQIDAGSSSSTGILFGASHGVSLRVVAMEAQESTKTFSTSYLALANSDVSLHNLKGITIGINGFRSSLEGYARLAVIKAGLNPQRDVKWLVVPLSQMGTALRSKRIDLGVFPTVFAKREFMKGGVKRVFSSASISGIEEEVDVYFDPKFVATHRAAVKAWAADFVNVTRYLVDHQKEARKAIIDSKIIRINPKIYLSMTAKDDLRRVPGAAPNAAMFAKLQKMLLHMKFMNKAVDVHKLIDSSLLPDAK